MRYPEPSCRLASLRDALSSRRSLGGECFASGVVDGWHRSVRGPWRVRTRVRYVQRREVRRGGEEQSCSSTRKGGEERARGEATVSQTASGLDPRIDRLACPRSPIPPSLSSLARSLAQQRPPHPIRSHSLRHRPACAPYPRCPSAPFCPPLRRYVAAPTWRWPTRRCLSIVDLIPVLPPRRPSLASSPLLRSFQRLIRPHHPRDAPSDESTAGGP